MKRKRRLGRPKLETTKQREKESLATEKVLREAGKHAQMSDEERQEMQTWLKGLEEMERQILKQFHVPPMKKSLAYKMASIGDESFVGHERRIIEEYRKVVSKGVRARDLGQKYNHEVASERQRRLISQHAELIERLTSHGFSKSRIAELVYEKMPPNTAPSIRTVRRWVTTYQELKLAKPIGRKIR